MKGHFLFRLLLLFCLFLGNTSHPVAARTTYPQNLWQYVNSPPQQSMYNEAKAFATAKELADASFRSKHKERTALLYATAQRLVAPEKEVVYQDMENIVRFVKVSKRKVKVSMRGRKSVYIHAGDGAIIKFPVQIFEDGTTYVHLRDFDPKVKRGGYKSFSRSIDLKTGQAYASLVTNIEKRRDAEVIVDELSKMYALRNVKSILGFRDVDSYVDRDAARGFQHKIAFQAELYDDDLSSYARQIGRDPSKVAKVAHDAALALNKLHTSGYIHRDVKPSNFFVRNVVTRLEVVLADLGLAYGSAMALGVGMGGTRGYIAPESCVLRAEKGVACTTSQEAVKADIYGLGMTLLSLLNEGDWGMRDRTYKINLMAMPKDGRPAGTPQAINSAVLDLKKYHTEEMRRAAARHGGADRQLSELRRIVWQMVDPDPKRRPSLDEVVRTLAPFNKAA